jgi:GxxExxY protein
MQTIHHKLVENILLAAKEVHATLGGGFFESIYEEALCYELALRSIPSERQYRINIIYKDTTLNKKFISDLFVDKKVLVELKAVKDLTTIEENQLMNHLKLSNIQVGLLLNFGPKLTVKRRILPKAVQGPPTPGKPADPESLSLE